MVPLPRSTRTIIVSFRLPAAQWQLLLNTQLNGNGKCLSGYGKARAILLDYLGFSGGDGVKAAHAAPDPEPALLQPKS
jgi:hypothetical protein